MFFYYVDKSVGGMTQLACAMECKFKKKKIQNLVLNLATNFANCFLDAPNYGLVYVLKEQSIEGY